MLPSPGSLLILKAGSQDQSLSWVHRKAVRSRDQGQVEGEANRRGKGDKRRGREDTSLGGLGWEEMGDA